MTSYLLSEQKYPTPENISSSEASLLENISTSIESIAPFSTRPNMYFIDAIKTLMLALDSLECQVVTALSIPSFESLTRGSFVNYLAKEEHDQIIRTLIGKLFPENIELNTHGENSMIDSTNTSASRMASQMSFPTIQMADLESEFVLIIEEYFSQSKRPTCLMDLLEILCEIEEKLLESNNLSEEFTPTGFVDFSKTTFLRFAHDLVAQCQESESIEGEKIDIDKVSSVLFPDYDILRTVDEEPVDEDNGVLMDNYKDLLTTSLRYGNKGVLVESVGYDKTKSLVTLLTTCTLEEFKPLQDRANVFTSIINAGEISTGGRTLDSSLLFSPHFPVYNIRSADKEPLVGDDKFVDKALKIFAKVPFGMLCSVGANWKLILRNLDPSEHLREIPVILQLGERKLQLDSTRKFMIISADDAIPVPVSLPTIIDIKKALHDRDVHLLASWYLLASTMDVSARSTFTANNAKALTEISAQEQESGCKVEYFEYRIGLEIAKCLPPYMGTLVLQPWIYEVTTEVFSGIKGETSESNFCEFIMSLPYAECLSTMSCVADMIAHVPNDILKILEEKILLVAKDEAWLPPTRYEDNHPKSAQLVHSVVSTSLQSVDSLVETEVMASGAVTQESDESFDENDSMMCERLIQKIYDSRDVQNSFDGSLKAALNLLSNMNSLNVHFVLEVIQNATDSNFAEDVLPTLSIQLSARKIVIRTNEVGFSKENVKAITAVGNSHKKNISGFIGQKGIG